jgi:hypothetical protein
MFITRGLGMSSTYANTVIVDGLKADIDNRDDVTGDISKKSLHAGLADKSKSYKSSIKKKTKHKVTIKTKGIL